MQYVDVIIYTIHSRLIFIIYKIIYRQNYNINLDQLNVQHIFD